MNSLHPGLYLRLKDLYCIGKRGVVSMKEVVKEGIDNLKAIEIHIIILCIIGRRLSLFIGITDNTERKEGRNNLSAFL